MKITRISQMQDCGVFRDFAWPSGTELADFGKFNLIYGWNGTGKTTLSRIFRNLELGETPAPGSVRLNLDGEEIDNAAFHDQPRDKSSLKVFNQDFVRANVFPIDGGDMAPIVVLGTTSVEAQQQIIELNEELDQINQSRRTAGAQLRESTRLLDSHAPAVARAIKDIMLSKDAANPYKNYTRTQYEERARTMIHDGDRAEHRLSADDRAILYDRQRDDQHSAVTLSLYNQPDFASLTAETSRLVSTAVPSIHAIQALSDNPELEQWIRRGMTDHLDDSHGLCPFCIQPLSSFRLNDLSDHFNEEREHLVQGIEELTTELESIGAATADLLQSIPHKDTLYKELGAQYDSALETLSVYVRDTRAFVHEQTQLLEDKKTSMHESMPSIAATIPETEDPLAQLATIVGQHNTISATHADAVLDAQKRLEADQVANHLDEYERITAQIQAAKAILETTEQRVNEIHARIGVLERETLSHQEPADRLNNDLRDYLGHDQLQLKVQERGYVMMRDGVPAQDPSEGEMTAIALLYFLQSLTDKDFELGRGVVVLDDPVSSLDANSLYMAAAFVRTRIASPGQLFILTHNFTFFREMMNWFRHLNGGRWDRSSKQVAQSYMLKSIVHDRQRQSQITALDPLLRDYESEYQYLFSIVYRAKETQSGDLALSYELPNVCRRLLEGFLAFRYPQVRSEQFWKKLEQVKFDDSKKAQIYRFVNAYSHNNGIDPPPPDLSVLAEASSVLKHILELMETEDAQHFQGLVKSLGDASENAANA